MRKTISGEPQPTTSQHRLSIFHHLAHNAQEKKSVNLSQYMKMRKSNKKEYETKEDLKGERMELILKQRAITRVGNLVQDQLNDRKKLLDTIDFNQISREEIFMSQLLNVLTKGDGFEGFIESFKIHKNQNQIEIDHHVKNQKQPQKRQIRSRRQSKIDKPRELKSQPVSLSRQRLEKKKESQPQPQPQNLAPPVIQKPRARKYTFSLDMDLIDSNG